MKNYSFGEPKNFIDDLPDDWFAKNNKTESLIDKPNESTNIFGSKTDLKPYLIGAVIGLAISYLLGSKK